MYVCMYVYIYIYIHMISTIIIINVCIYIYIYSYYYVYKDGDQRGQLGGAAGRRVGAGARGCNPVLQGNIHFRTARSKQFLELLARKRLGTLWE